MEHNLETRIIRLEETLYFQDEKLKILDSELMAQQAQLSSLSRKVEEMLATLGELKDILAENRSPATGEIPPPHYQQKKW